MANKEVKKYRRVYDRKIIRKMLKKEAETNKINNSWKQIIRVRGLAKKNEKVVC